MKILLLLFLLITLGASAQDLSGEYANWKNASWNVQLKFEGNRIFRLSGKMPKNGWINLKGKYSVQGDTIIVSNTPPAKATVSYRWQNYGPRINLNVIDQYSKRKIHGLQRISYDGVTEKSVSSGDRSGVYVQHMLSDSLRLNGEWIKIDTSNQRANGRLKITTITQEINKSQIFNDSMLLYPMYFDSLRFVFDGTTFSYVSSPEFTKWDMSRFTNLREKTWTDYHQEIGVSDQADYSFIHNDSIKILSIDSLGETILDLRKYSNLKKLNVTNASNSIKIKSTSLDALSIKTIDYVPLSLELDQDVLKSYGGTPIKRSNLKTINGYGVGIVNESGWDALNSFPVQVNYLSISDRRNPANFRLKDNIKVRQGLTVMGTRCDSCELNFSWSPQLRASLEHLSFSYVFLANYDFLKLPNHLETFGMYMKNETLEDMNRLKKMIPRSKVLTTNCFLLSSNVTSKSNGQVRLDQLKIGDSIAGIQDGQIVYSQVTAIEYHFNIEMELIQLKQQTALASLSHQNHHSYKVQSTPNHPINSDLGIPTTIEKLNNDNLIYTLTGSSRLEDFTITHQPYSGTLINVRTSLGNYFIDGINFFNK